MKLLNYTTTYFAIILFVLLTLWAVIFYFEMLDEIYDSIDDGLENQKMLVIRQAKEDTTVLNKTEFDDGYYTIKQTSYSNARSFTDSYRDTLMYMQNEEDFEPVRLLETVFKQDDSFYRLKIKTSMVEEDDLIKELFFSLLWLYAGLIFSILLLNNFIHKKIWKPFYNLLGRLSSFNIEKDEKVSLESTKIEEFSLLNKRIEHLLDKSVQSYRSQKEFIENASHELQTPLAISINKLELLVEGNHLQENQLEQLASTLDNLERLKRFNKSLLLLSKIENKQFPEKELVNFNMLIKEIALEFADLSTHKKMKVEIVEEADFQLSMNRDLANILLSNLIKNALVHGITDGVVEVRLTQNSISIKNNGVGHALDSTKIFSRFQKTQYDKKSTGLGLAISKAISERFEIQLEYYYQDAHIFKLKIREN